MAHIYGRPGSYLDRRALLQSQTALGLFAGGMFVVGLASGMAFGFGHYWALLLVLPAVCLLGYGIWRGIDRMEAYRRAIIKGADGETRTAFALEDLPDTFHVFHDIENGRGNIDHIVVGPTGVFAVETKNWRDLSREEMQRIAEAVERIRRAGAPRQDNQAGAQDT